MCTSEFYNSKKLWTYLKCSVLRSFNITLVSSCCDRFLITPKTPAYRRSKEMWLP